MMLPGQPAAGVLPEGSLRLFRVAVAEGSFQFLRFVGNVLLNAPRRNGFGNLNGFRAADFPTVGTVTVETVILYLRLFSFLMLAISTSCSDTFCFPLYRYFVADICSNDTQLSEKRPIPPK